MATDLGPTTIDLTWTPPTSDGGSPITGYRIEASANVSTGWVPIANTGETNSYTHSGRLPGTTLYYRVAAINDVGTGNPSNVVPGTTPGSTGTAGAPSNLTAVAAGPSTIILTWGLPTPTGGNTITGYQIEWSRTGSSPWALVETTSPTVFQYLHRDLPAGTIHFYRVRAVYANSFGPWTSPVNATTAATAILGAPRNLTATADGPSAIYLDWAAPSSTGGSAITGYEVTVSADGGVSFGPPQTTVLTEFRHTGLAAGTTRHYRVRARNANGFGPWTSAVNATTSTGTPPGPPRALRATAVGSSAIELSWSAPLSSGSSAIIGYRIESSSTRTGGWSDLVANTGNTRTTYLGHGPRAEHEPLLPGLGDQLLRHGSPLEHRRRHHPAGRAECARAIDGRGPRDIGHRVGLDAAIVQRNVPGDRLPDRVVEHEHRQMAESCGQHAFDDDEAHR